ncbi:hypothetical protein F5Y09DRAFT_11551 [Xylaria sp. FL1042]|nr:hypothetical protein F5Y09DRAFT_11551 [Xylaria sp. FL1042]
MQPSTHGTSYIATMAHRRNRRKRRVFIIHSIQVTFPVSQLMVSLYRVSFAALFAVRRTTKLSKTASGKNLPSIARYLILFAEDTSMRGMLCNFNPLACLGLHKFSRIRLRITSSFSVYLQNSDILSMLRHASRRGLYYGVHTPTPEGHKLPVQV